MPEQDPLSVPRRRCRIWLCCDACNAMCFLAEVVLFFARGRPITTEPWHPSPAAAAVHQPGTSSVSPASAL